LYEEAIALTLFEFKFSETSTTPNSQITTGSIQQKAQALKWDSPEELLELELVLVKVEEGVLKAQKYSSVVSAHHTS
jgi:hypothetical protein